MRGILHQEDWGWANAPRFGGGSSGTSTSTNYTNTTPWVGQQQYLYDVFGNAQGLYDNSANWPQYYPSSTYAGLTPTQQSLIGEMANYGENGGTSGLNNANNAISYYTSPNATAQTAGTFDQAQNYLSNMISGSTTNPWSSPGFQSLVNNTLANTIPATTSGFVGGGRSDSGLAQRAATEGATDAIGQLANTNYTTEQGLQQNAANIASNNALTQQGNQLKAAAVAPSTDAATASAMETGYNAAAQQQSDVQNQLNYLVNKWNYNQDLPWNMLSQYSNIVGGTGYGSSSQSQTSTPYYSNTLANVGSAASSLGSLGLLASVLL